MTFVTAEIGANWKGDYDLLRRMLQQCKMSGINAVKFQSLGQEYLDRHPELPEYKASSVTEDNVKYIDKICKKFDIEWYSTPSYPEAVDFLNPYVKRWKIWFGGRDRQDIIDKCMETGKQIIISADRRDDRFKGEGYTQLYCIPRYPVDYGEINFAMMKDMDGFSCHCLDPLSILRSVREGAKYIEFHITDSKDRFAIDNKVSYTYGQVWEIMKWIKMNDSLQKMRSES